MWRKRHHANEIQERTVGDPEKARERTMNRAVKLLAAKPRSIGELRERLLEKTWTDEAIVNTVIEKLVSYDYLNDRQFARDLALSNLRRKPQGIRRLKSSLAQKKLNEDDVQAAIASAFEQMPVDELIEAAIEKRVRLKGRPVSREDERRFIDHLLRLGFDYDLIRSSMGRMMRDARTGDSE